MGGFFSTSAQAPSLGLGNTQTAKAPRINNTTNIEAPVNFNGAKAPSVNTNIKNVEVGVKNNIRNNTVRNNTTRNNIAINVRNKTSKNNVAINVRNNNRKNNSRNNNAAKNNIAINIPENESNIVTNDPSSRSNTPNSMVGGKRKSRRGRKSRHYTRKH